MKVTEIETGTLIESEHALAFFGNRNSNIDSLGKTFSNLKFVSLKQMHGENIVEATPIVQVADAHWTSQPNWALCIQTADCIPLLISSNRFVAAVHAGWRGVHNQIARKTLIKMQSLGCDIKTMTVLIGPHIQSHSFEIENEWAEKIVSTVSNPTDCQTPGPNGKSLVDLNLVVRNQLLEAGASASNFFVLPDDTKTNQSYHSFRRDPSNAGRQISFIALR